MPGCVTCDQFVHRAFENGFNTDAAFVSQFLRVGQNFRIDIGH
jgi:hypothetical protein